MDKGIMSMLLFLVLCTLLFFFLRKEPNINIKGQFVKHSTLVLIGYLIVHFQFYVDYVLGNATISNTFIWVNTSIVIKSMVLSTIGLLCFLLGYLLQKGKMKRRNVEDKEINTNALILVAGCALGVYFMTVNPLYLMGYYGEESLGAEATYAIMIFRLVTYAAIIQNCRNLVLANKTKLSFKEYFTANGKILNALFIIYMLSVLLSGDRGPLITFSLLYLSGYLFVTKKRISLKFGLILLFAGATFITILGQVRRMDNDLSFTERFTESIGTDAYEEPSIIPQTRELAGSVKAVHQVVDAVPSMHDYLYGRFQFQQIFSAIPFFDTFSPLIFEEQHYRFGGSARFVTWLAQGDHPRYGNGTSSTSDFYLDFGLLGVILGMFLFGYCMRYAEVAMYSKGLPTLLTHVFFIVYLCNAIYIARSTVLFQFKSMILIFVILLVNKYFLQSKIQ